MADQQSTHAALSSAVNTYYEKKILESFEPKTHFFSLAPIRTTIPKGNGKTVEFTRYLKIAPKISDNTDEFTASQAYFSAEVVTATVHFRDSYVQLSRETCLQAIGDVLSRAADKVQEAAVKTVDILVRNDIGMMVADVANASSLNYSNMSIDGGTLNSSGKTARVWSHDKAAAGDRFAVYHNKTRLAQSALVTSFAKTALTVKTIQHAVMVMQSQDVPPASDGYYHMICHPSASYQITTSPGFKGWISPTSSAPLKNMPSEVGIVAGVKIHNSTLGLAFPLSADTLSTSSGTLYASLLFGKDAYGVAEIATQNGRQGFSFFLKESGPQTTSDPTNMKKQAGYSVATVGKILNKSAGVWLLSTSIT